MVGFNNVGFDYPILHLFVQQRGKVTTMQLYEKAQAIIGSQDTNRWQHMVYPSDRYVPQIDLYLIHHFDNKARATSLKALEFNMRLDSVQDLPFPVGTILNREQIALLREYNAHDVHATKLFYEETLPMIRFREELTAKYNRDFTNHNDTKIGKDYFVMELEKAGVQCYDYSPDKGRTPRQTIRPQIALKDAILPWVRFETPQFQNMLEWFKQQTITETKGVFDDLSVVVNGFEFVFGLGGIHGSIENEIVEADEWNYILDLDVTSYYPSLAIHNKFAPAHLGAKFCDIYADLKDRRVTYKKGTAENAMLKLALNGVYGDSNNKFSVFYDPLFTMSITLNGQLLLCLLAENLMKVPGLRIIQCNTDGITIRSKRHPFEENDPVLKVCEWWQQVSGMVLESANYHLMAIRDVNNYLAEGSKGVKRKGAYEYDLEWHQNGSALVIPKIAEQVLLKNVPIMDTLQSWPDKMDFMLRVKVPRSSRLVSVFEGRERLEQNTTRYYVAKGGVELVKIMPPLKGKTEDRRFAVEKGRTVCVCNDMKDAVLPIDYSYYASEIEKLTLKLR
jgi:hypothetical protein